jgi:hypothetical protein
MLEMIQRSKGQILLTWAQINWTKEVTQALLAKEASSTGPDLLRKLKGTYKKKIDLYTQCVENQNLKANQRAKIIALIIMEEHNREVIEKLYADKTVTGPSHFSW